LERQASTFHDAELWVGGEVAHIWPAGEVDRTLHRPPNDHRRHHEALGNLTAADMYDGRQREISSSRKQIKRKTLDFRCPADIFDETVVLAS
jgi:hypothetical protein